VLIAYGLADAWTCDRLFNVVSLFGRVIKVKLLQSKRGSGMCQMEDFAQAQTVISNMHMLSLFGQQVQFQHSKHPFIAESTKPTDGLPANPTKDYAASPLNRYRPSKESPRPSHRLCYSATCACDPTSIKSLFHSLGAQEPISISPTKAEGADVAAGIIECHDVSVAVETVAIANNATISDGHILKLSFALPK
jgi:heterogeneous nuclear ribonucleoprotein L